MSLDPESRKVVSAFAQGLINLSSGRTAELAGSARSDIATFSLSGKCSAPGETSDSSQGLSASVSSNLVYAGGAFAATSFLGSAYAILVPNGELKGQRVDFRPVGGEGPAAV
jgi:hypothetical protein